MGRGNFVIDKHAQVILGIILIILLCSQTVWALPEIYILEARPGISQEVLLDKPSGPTRGGLIMFPGGGGADMFKKKNGGVRLGRNFLVRSSPEFVKQGLVVAIVDAPSDQAGGMSAAFRTCPAHAQDIIKVIDFLDNQGLKPIFLAGTSRGTLSAAYLATVPIDARIKGLVLTASLGEELSRLPLQNVTLPVLLVHHKDDACKTSPFEGAMRLKGLFSKSPRVDLVEVQGGLPPESDPCRAMSAHGFLGKETEVVKIISDWFAGRPVPARIGP